MDYDTWISTTPDDWYEESLDSIEKGYAKEWLDDVIKAIYITGDVAELENSLGELAAIYDVKLPKLEPMLKLDMIECMRREIQSMKEKLEEL